MSQRQTSEPAKRAAPLRLGTSRGPFDEQARRQEAVAFARRLETDGTLRPQARLMGWALVPAPLVAPALALLVDPLAGLAVSPLSALGLWYWRRVLRSFVAPLRPTTRRDDTRVT